MPSATAGGQRFGLREVAARSRLGVRHRQDAASQALLGDPAPSGRQLVAPILRNDRVGDAGRGRVPQRHRQREGRGRRSPRQIANRLRVLGQRTTPATQLDRHRREPGCRSCEIRPAFRRPRSLRRVRFAHPRVAPSRRVGWAIASTIDFRAAASPFEFGAAETFASGAEQPLPRGFEHGPQLGRNGRRGIGRRRRKRVQRDGVLQAVQAMKRARAAESSRAPSPAFAARSDSRPGRPAGSAPRRASRRRRGAARGSRYVRVARTSGRPPSEARDVSCCWVRSISVRR